MSPKERCSGSKPVVLAVPHLRCLVSFPLKHPACLFLDLPRATLELRPPPSCSDSDISLDLFEGLLEKSIQIQILSLSKTVSNANTGACPCFSDPPPDPTWLLKKGLTVLSLSFSFQLSQWGDKWGLIGSPEEFSVYEARPRPFMNRPFPGPRVSG